MKWLLLLLLTSCQTAPTHYRATIDACIAEQLELCGDLICEGDEVFEQVIIATYSAINYCLDYPDTIPAEYYNKKLQAEILARYGVLK